MANRTSWLSFVLWPASWLLFSINKRKKCLYSCNSASFSVSTRCKDMSEKRSESNKRQSQRERLHQLDAYRIQQGSAQSSSPESCAQAAHAEAAQKTATTSAAHGGAHLTRIAGSCGISGRWIPARWIAGVLDETKSQHDTLLEPQKRRKSRRPQTSMPMLKLRVSFSTL